MGVIQDNRESKRRLSKWKVVHTPFDSAGYDSRELLLIETLANACRHVEDLYWHQSDPEARQQLKADTSSGLSEDQHPSPGRTLYPSGITRDEIESYISKYPEDHSFIYDPHTVLRWHHNRLTGIPYHVEYGSYLTDIAGELRAAANLSTEPDFSKYLELRAEGLCNGDYFPSDAAWVHLDRPAINIIIGPHEAYIDRILGVKTAYEAALLLRNDSLDEYLSWFQRCIAELQNDLPFGHDLRPLTSLHESPIEIVDVAFQTGDLRHGYQSVAANLPNDPYVREAVGTRKIIFKNLLEARLEHIIMPLAQQLLVEDQITSITPLGYFIVMALHELAHDIEPLFIPTRGKASTSRDALGTMYLTVEEAKGDVLGMLAVESLERHGILNESNVLAVYSSFIASMFRTLRSGLSEPHGCAHAIEFNYMRERKAVFHSDSRYRINYSSLRNALHDLANELVSIEAAGDKSRAERLIDKYQLVPAELEDLFARLEDVPREIYPTFSFD
jgi:hypothetical protein